jgi:hypothetical protein
MPADLPAVGAEGWPSSAYVLSVSATTGIVITAGTESGLLVGTTTLLQASVGGGGGTVQVPTMEVHDRPFREWRGIQLDLHGTPYHSLDLFKTFIRMARWYKLNTLTFNIGPNQWLSPAMYGARFRQQFTLEDAIGFRFSCLCSASSAPMRVTNGIPLGCSRRLLPPYTLSKH